MKYTKEKLQTLVSEFKNKNPKCIFTNQDSSEFHYLQNKIEDVVFVYFFTTSEKYSDYSCYEKIRELSKEKSDSNKVMIISYCEDNMEVKYC